MYFIIHCLKEEQESNFTQNLVQIVVYSHVYRSGHVTREEGSSWIRCQIYQPLGEVFYKRLRVSARALVFDYSNTKYNKIVLGAGSEHRKDYERKDCHERNFFDLCTSMTVDEKASVFHSVINSS